MGVVNPKNYDHKASLQHIANMSFDPVFEVSATELLSYDPLANAMKRVTTNAMGEYATNDLLESGAITYVGKEDAAGDWFIQKIDTSSGTSIRYATVNNNASITSYSDGWTNKLTLTYDTYSVAF